MGLCQTTMLGHDGCVNQEKCSRCGARLDPAVDWCTLCFTPVRPAQPPAAPRPAPSGPGRTSRRPDGPVVPPLQREPLQQEWVTAEPGPTTSRTDEPTGPRIDPEAARAQSMVDRLAHAEGRSTSGWSAAMRQPAVRWSIMVIGPLLIAGVLVGLAAVVI